MTLSCIIKKIETSWDIYFFILNNLAFSLFSYCVKSREIVWATIFLKNNFLLSVVNEIN